jgi:hypothetical protein
MPADSDVMELFVEMPVATPKGSFCILIAGHADVAF